MRTDLIQYNNKFNYLGKISLQTRKFKSLNNNKTGGGSSSDD